MISEPDFRTCLGGEYERMVLAFSKALNPQLLQSGVAQWPADQTAVVLGSFQLCHCVSECEQGVSQEESSTLSKAP